MRNKGAEMDEMKAIICTRYGPPDVLQIVKYKKPLPKDDEVLIKVYATSVTNSDILLEAQIYR